MRSLQYRIALILIASIVAVVFVASAATFWMLSSSETLRMIDPTAERIALTQDLLRRSVQTEVLAESPLASPQGGSVAASGSAAANDTGGSSAAADSSANVVFPLGPPIPLPLRDVLMDFPASGTPRDDLTSALAAAVAKRGLQGELSVVEGMGGRVIASYRFDNGRWVHFGFPQSIPPPPGLWALLAGWVGAVVLGVAITALIMARRVTEPFDILEGVVATVGPDGAFPHIPEKGSGEARHTAAVLNRLSERLRVSMESRMRLVAAAGHDLRTPMTRMRLRAEFLPDEDRQGWIDDIDELELIAESAIHLVREEAARDDQANVALDTLVRQTVDELVAANLSVRLEGTEPAVVRAAPLSLRRALRNLFTNAATHGGGAVVRLAADERQATVIIDDEGPGIPPELMGRMFEPFFRVNPARGKNIKGAGLGLAIAKDIVERFGGSIDISNRPEGGLRQIVTLAQLGGKAS